MRAFATMGALAGFPDTLIPKEGTSDTRVPVGVPWVSGMSAPFLQPLEEWWSTNATASSSGNSFQAKAAASRHPVVPEGATLDGILGQFLADRQPLVFPSPLSTPSAEKRKKFEKDRQAACEAFSSFHTLLGVVRILEGLSKSSVTMSPAVLGSHLSPLISHSLRRLVPSLQSAVGIALNSHLEMWRQAVKPLPVCARNDILSVFPWNPNFGSVEAVVAAASRNPQLDVTIRGQAMAGAKGSASSKTVGSQVHQPPSSSRPSTSGGRYHPYRPPPGQHRKGFSHSSGKQSHYSERNNRRSSSRPRSSASSQSFRGPSSKGHRKDNR